MTIQRNTLLQAIALIIIIAICSYFYINIQRHLQLEDVPSGFAFLNKAGGFIVIMDLIPFDTSSTNLRAFLVGILNTLFLAALAIVFSTILGTFLSILNSSRNWLLVKASGIYVAIFTNIPLLLQILFWYFVFLNYMPQPNNSFSLLGVIFNVQGISFLGITLIPELIAMLLGLTLYASGHICLHILHAIATITKGQIEAAIASRITGFLQFRLIIFPQAIRVMMVPIVQQHLTTFKNTALGAAVGYPDLVAIFTGTVLTQTGQAIETIFMTMSFYLFVSMLTAFFLDVYQAKIGLRVNK